MERRKLTKEDIDKVRNIEGFPIGTDEDIIALSAAPYYTACPNPFIEEFIAENGTDYDEQTDDYHCEPYTSDVSEGKHDPYYMAHGYHTKVPYMAIMKYILHYTKPGDIVLDAFCGTGMAGVAALRCGASNDELKKVMLENNKNVQWGKRNAIVSDLSPIASFIAANYTTEINMLEFNKIVEPIIDELEGKYGWMFMTEIEGKHYPVNYYVWSDVDICESCSQEFLYWDAIVDETGTRVYEKMMCPHCHAELSNNDFKRAFVDEYDQYSGTTERRVKQELVMVKYTNGKSQFKKKPDTFDIINAQKAAIEKNSSWVPENVIEKGDKTGEPLKIKIDRAYKYYTSRNLYILSKFYEEFDNIAEERYKNFAKFLFSSVYSRSHKMNRYMPNYNRHVGPLSGTLYFPFFMAEINVFNLFRDKLDAMVKMGNILGDAVISNQSATDLANIPSCSIDYIFTDPPFGDNIMYSELNYVNECWNKIITNTKPEAIINKTQQKKLSEYQELMNDALKEYFRVLKPGRWITVEFHNSKNSVWNAIQQAINVAGFVIADVRTLDKKKGTTNQLSYGYAVKQDLVISAYKPKEIFKKQFISDAGREETAWHFVRQHLLNLPIVVDSDRNGKIDILQERQAFLLFDRMVAYHIMQGIPVPIDASSFYIGLNEHFIERDGMYFLPDQVNEYDVARIKMDVEDIQMELLVTNEKSAIAWLYQQLEEPQTYADLQPKFMQEAKTTDKYELIPELAMLLEENFIQNDKGEWYIPDVTKEADVNKLREKRLWKEFEGYLNSKGKLKLFRSEAIRVGFAKLWKEQNYKTIVEVAERLPEKVVQEDANILMYYDISLSRI